MAGGTRLASILLLSVFRFVRAQDDKNDNTYVVLFAVLGAEGGYLIFVIVLLVAIHCKRKAGFRLPNRMECNDASREPPGVQGDQVPSDGDEYHIYSVIPASAHEGHEEGHTYLELSNGTSGNDLAGHAAATNGEENANPYDKPGPKESHTYLELSNGTDDNDHARHAAATNGEENVNPYDKPGPKESHAYLELSNGTDDNDHARHAAATNGEENVNPYDKPGPKESHTYLELSNGTDDKDHARPAAATNGEENANPYDKPGPKESHTYLELPK